jgi:hypothetical protein
VLRAAVDVGVDHIDTARYYGPGVVNELWLTRQSFPAAAPDLWCALVEQPSCDIGADQVEEFVTAPGQDGPDRTQ